MKANFFGFLNLVFFFIYFLDVFFLASIFFLGILCVFMGGRMKLNLDGWPLGRMRNMFECIRIRYVRECV